jgi:predicted ATPase
MAKLTVGLCSCSCETARHEPRLVVLTGGPGAGKTAVLEMAKYSFCSHVAILPESASIIFGGGFPRLDGLPARRAVQRAILGVQQALELLVHDAPQVAVALCDRGTLDGAAYWPDGVDRFCPDLGLERAAELARYAAVIHLEPPTAGHGYQNSSIRTETAGEAAEIDRCIEQAWRGHPQVHRVASTETFPDKARIALELVRQQLPACCRNQDSWFPGRPSHQA